MLLIALSLLACHSDTDTETDPQDTEEVDTGLVFEGLPLEYWRFCGGMEWESTLTEATVQELGGHMLGGGYDMAGAAFSMKIVPQAPFRAHTLRVGLQRGPGPVELRVVTTFGRSYPDLDGEDPGLPLGGPDLIEPVLLQTEVGTSPEWVEVDISDQEVFLLPGQHYHIVVVQQEGGPGVVRNSIPDGEHSRALILVPGEDMPYGDDANYRMVLEGETFCDWAPEAHWFQLDAQAPFASEGQSRAAIIDIDSDGHDDLMTMSGGPRVFLGDGRGGFTAAPEEWLADAAGASMLVFADMDNDGDQDAFVGYYVGVDEDGDGRTKEEGDCNDADPAVHQDRSELEGNGRDDDCDGVADDGTDTTDADGDGVSIAEGDCDDTLAEVYPGAPETKNNRDDDCDQVADEDWANRILLGDGTGQLNWLAEAGVEALDHATAAGFGDADGDGYLDLYWGNWLEKYPNDPAVQDRYVVGQGDGTFVDGLVDAGLELDTPLSCYGVTWNDYDDDGDADIYVANYHLYDNQLWQNQGDGTFVDVAADLGAAHDDIPSGYSQYPGGHSYGVDFGDVDNDGDMDAFVTNLSHPRTSPWADPSMFLVSQGGPGFAFDDLKVEAGFIYDEGDVNVAMADYDCDMDLDLAVASLYTGHYSRLYRNDGEARFTDVTWEAGVAVHDSVSVVWSDFDEDGDLDLVIADRAGDPWVHLFHNEACEGRHWVELDLQGTTSNRDAVGARVWLTAGGVTQIRDVWAGRGHSNTQDSHWLHFGLGDHETIDGLEVRWPSGLVETFEVTPDGRHVLVEGSGAP